jgi:hypothetical protein
MRRYPGIVVARRGVGTASGALLNPGLRGICSGQPVPWVGRLANFGSLVRADQPDGHFS